MDAITLVIPAYNEAAHVADQIRRVEAVLATTGWQYEILVIDDGSTDATAANAATAATAADGATAAPMLAAPMPAAPMPAAPGPGRVRVVLTVAMVVWAFIGVAAVKVARRQVLEAQVEKATGKSAGRAPMAAEGSAPARRESEPRKPTPV